MQLALGDFDENLRALLFFTESNSSLLEGKVKHGINGAQPELYYFPLHFVVSIRRQNYDTQEIEHVCMGCMISAVKGVMPYECKQ